MAYAINDPRNPGHPLVSTCDHCGKIVTIGAEGLREAPGYETEDFCGGHPLVQELGEDIKGELMKTDDTPPEEHEIGHDFIRPNSSKWSSRYTLEKTSSLTQHVLTHPMLGDIAQGIGEKVTQGLHAVGDAAGYVRDAITFHTDPTTNPHIIDQAKSLTDQAKVYDPSSWDATSRLQKAHDLLDNAREHNWARDAVGVGLHGLNALLLKTQIPKAIERFRPTPPHRDLSGIQEKQSLQYCSTIYYNIRQLSRKKEQRWLKMQVFLELLLRT